MRPRLTPTDNGLVAVLRIIAAEVFDECRNLTLELYIERLDDVEPPATRLPGYNPVDIGVVVHADADRRVGIREPPHIHISDTHHALRSGSAELRDDVGPGGKEFGTANFDYVVITHFVLIYNGEYINN